MLVMFNVSACYISEVFWKYLLQLGFLQGFKSTASTVSGTLTYRNYQEFHCLNAIALGPTPTLLSIVFLLN